MKRIMGLLVLSLFLALYVTTGAMAGQIVTHDDGTPITDGIFGNGPDDTVGASTGNGGWNGDPGDLLDPNGNTVNFTDGDAVTNTKWIHGAYIENSGSFSDDVSADDNTVNISDSTVTHVYGAFARSSGSGDAAASGNTVTFDGTSAGAINGGHAESDSGIATATNNTVTISGGTVEYATGG